MGYPRRGLLYTYYIYSTMKTKLILWMAFCLVALPSSAQDDDIYFVPSKQKKQAKQQKQEALPWKQQPLGQSSYKPLYEDSVFTTTDWSEGRKSPQRDVDEYNRRGGTAESAPATFADSLEAAYNQGYADGKADGAYTERIVRFYAPSPGVYVSSPYYLDYYDLAYDPWYWGYGSWGCTWSGWYGWGSWYGWRPYYAGWGWYDPFWDYRWYPYHHHHYYTYVPAKGPTHHYGNNGNRPFRGATSRSGGFASTGRGSGRFGGGSLGFRSTGRPGSRSGGSGFSTTSRDNTQRRLGSSSGSNDKTTRGTSSTRRSVNADSRRENSSYSTGQRSSSYNRSSSFGSGSRSSVGSSRGGSFGGSRGSFSGGGRSRR